jgi:carboxyl-terminal processing protease
LRESTDRLDRSVSAQTIGPARPQPPDTPSSWSGSPTRPVPVAPFPKAAAEQGAEPLATANKQLRRPRLQPEDALRPLFSWLLASAMVLGLVFPAPPALALNDAQQLVVEAWRLVNQSYVDPQQLEAVHWRRLRQQALEKPIQQSGQAYDAIEAMLQPLNDPYTRLLRPPEFASLRSNTRGTVTGVGLQLGLRDGGDRIVVIAPLDDSPAAAAGVASGWEVLAVNGLPTNQLGLEGTAAALRGAADSDVLVQLEPPGQRPRELQLRRRSVDLQPVRYRRLDGVNQDLGYLRITQFSEPVPQLVRQSLAELSDTSGGQPPLRGLILDLRNNSGGLVSAGLAVADAFLDGTAIVETHDRSGISDRPQAGPGQLYSGPLLTLVNGGTASASEILAGALQDAGRSRLMGSRSFGKGLIQTLIPLGDGSGLAVTVARYLTPAGQDIQNQVIVPDLALAGEEPLNPGGEGDGWLSQAARWLASDRSNAPAAGEAHG